MLLFYLQMTITDNDLIEKSNLNRQFLFRPHHIQVKKAFHSYSLLTDILMQKWTLRVCLHGGGGPQVGEVTRLGRVTHPSI